MTFKINAEAPHTKFLTLLSKFLLQDREFPKKEEQRALSIEIAKGPLLKVRSVHFSKMKCEKSEKF